MYVIRDAQSDAPSMGVNQDVRSISVLNYTVIIHRVEE